MNTIRVGLIGDYHPSVKAHIAIPRALALAAEAAGCKVDPVWTGTELLGGDIEDAERKLAGFDAIWCVPASPYVSMEGALRAIRFARERKVPFLGTCGGFQHALIEYARNVLGIEEADHAESNPEASVLFITPLVCALREAKGTILLQEGSRARTIYGRDGVEEAYNCSFGLNPDFGPLLNDSDLRITGLDTEGEVRIVELKDHPFFIATLFQPERAALAGNAHPLIDAYVQVAASVTVGSRGS